MLLIDSILLAPLKGVVWLAQKVGQMAENELCDESRIKEELMELQLKFELDQISQQEYDRKEEELLARLDAAANAEEKET